jgi:hypothetical protein
MTQRHPLSTLIDFLRDTSSRTGRTTSSRPTPTEPTSNSATVNSAPGPKNPFTNEPYQDAIKAATQEIRKARDEWDRAPGYSRLNQDAEPVPDFPCQSEMAQAAGLPQDHPWTEDQVRRELGLPADTKVIFLQADGTEHDDLESLFARVFGGPDQGPTPPRKSAADTIPGYSEFIDGLASALGAGPVTGPVTAYDKIGTPEFFGHAGQPVSSLDSLLDEIAQEVERAQDMHAPMHSLHEGYAVLKEELDELWDEVRMKHPDFERARKEAIQCAAMAVRLVLDVVEPRIKPRDI